MDQALPAHHSVEVAVEQPPRRILTVAVPLHLVEQAVQALPAEGLVIQTDQVVQRQVKELVDC
jgi:hypothetical protein